LLEGNYKELAHCWQESILKTTTFENWEKSGHLSDLDVGEK